MTLLFKSNIVSYALFNSFIQLFVICACIVFKKIDEKILKIILFVYFISSSLFSFHFRVCTGYGYGEYIKYSTLVSSGIALIHVLVDFFAGKRGQCFGTRAGLLGFISFNGQTRKTNKERRSKVPLIPIS